jgi:hypothetical protein
LHPIDRDERLSPPDPGSDLAKCPQAGPLFGDEAPHERVLTTIDTTVQAEREQDLLDGFTEMNDGPKPDGLLRSELLRGQAGA